MCMYIMIAHALYVCMKGQSGCAFLYSWLSLTHNGVQDSPYFLLLFLRLGQQVVGHGVSKDVTNDL